MKHFKSLESGGYRAMDELRDAGMIKAIGLGVNENKVSMDALSIGSWDCFCLRAGILYLNKKQLTNYFQPVAKLARQ